MVFKQCETVICKAGAGPPSLLCFQKYAYLVEHLALPELQWIGVHPSEITVLRIQHAPLNVSDEKKIKLIMKRPYMASYPKIQKELQLMLDRKFKADIEGVIRSNSQFLTNFYLTSKLYNHEYF